MKKGIRGHDVRAQGLENICDTAKKSGIEYLQLVWILLLQYGTKHL